MINHETGEVTLTIRGTVYTLALKMAGLMALQKRLSPAGQIRKLPDIIAEMQLAIEAQSLEHMVLFLWAALQKHHPGTTEDDVVNLIDDAGGLAGLENTFASLAHSMTPDKADVAELTPVGGGGNPRPARAKKTIPGDGGRSTSAPAALA